MASSPSRKPVHHQRLTTMKKPGHIHLVALSLFGAIGLFSMMPVAENKGGAYRPESFAEWHKTVFLLDPVPQELIFPTTYYCGGCHGPDYLMHAMVDEMGNDVNLFDDFSTTMMANSAKDPFWQAKVSHEMLVNPGHSLDLQTKCTSCHAPQGHYTAILRGAQHYTMADLLADSVGIQGVSCGACHSISPENLGKEFSGQIRYDTNRVAYGPYESPFAGPMTDFVGFQPVYSPHINDAGLCASCHTLITKSVDLNGNYTGSDFVEQATYHEWLNSAYNTDGGATPQTCQGCHLPRIDDSVVISSGYAFLEGRSPFGQHELVGGNTAMLKLMKANKAELSIGAADEHFDETIAKTLRMLQEKTLDVRLELENITDDTIYFSVLLRNKAGHKFPSGYPSRRAFVEFTVTGAEGPPLFHSGAVQPNYEVAGQGPGVMPHFDMINREDQVQIYELVLGDVNGDFTTVLERSHQALKDNRLPPAGFTTGHTAYDTTRVVGAALTDPDFNTENGQQGSGTDRIRFHIPRNLYSGLVDASVRIYYQSLPPKWMAPLLAENTPAINAFREMYQEADLTPVLIGSDSLGGLVLEPVSVQEPGAGLLEIYPTVVRKGQTVHFGQSAGLRIAGIRIFDISGRRILEKTGNISEIVLPPYSAGVYILEVMTDKGRIVQKIIGNL
ncbi:MAG TPA: T9SS type A sorting domain-containing protein [Flavilitoribacter sp.]|nr:T9SS type A sorting domain-containing protein [Flavilitoribacter sp.]